jgi:hypothetical protein
MTTWSKIRCCCRGRSCTKRGIGWHDALAWDT